MDIETREKYLGDVWSDYSDWRPAGASPAKWLVDCLGSLKGMTVTVRSAGGGFKRQFREVRP